MATPGEERADTAGTLGDTGQGKQGHGAGNEHGFHDEHTRDHGVSFEGDRHKIVAVPKDDTIRVGRLVTCTLYRLYAFSGHRSHLPSHSSEPC